MPSVTQRKKGLRQMLMPVIENEFHLFTNFFMKTSLYFSVVSCLLSLAFVCQAQPATTVPPSTPYSITGRSANSREWENTAYELLPSGQIIPHVHQYRELATGLCYQRNGQWLDSQEQISAQPDGTAAATNGQHQVYFPGDIYSGAIQLITPDGLQLQSRPVGLSYDDGTNMVLIAELTNSLGQLIGSNQAIYTNAFTGVNADLLYTYTKAGFEQNIILNEQPPSPESYGLNPQTARLQLVTEFFNPPQPAVATALLPEQAGLALTDDTLGFGTMKMLQGRAFLIGTSAAEPQVLVGKQWLSLDGRQFLVEQVPVAALENQLSQLPAPQMSSAKGKSPSKLISATRQLPPQRLVKTVNAYPMQMTRARVPTRGLLLDYQILNTSQTNSTFRGDTTYYISSAVDLFGTNTFEGGSVLKYATNASITLESGGVLNCLASAYRPVIFTAKDDNSVGQTISGSTGNPTNYYADPALFFNYNSASGLQDFRVTFAQCAINDAMESTFGLTNGEIVNCASGVGANGQASLTLNLRNMLIANVGTNINLLGVGEPGIYAQNTTFANTEYLFAQNFASGSGPMFLTMYNCLLCNVTNDGLPSTKLGFYCNGANNGFYKLGAIAFGSNTKSTTVNPFQTVGAGNYYLTNGCVFHNAGTTGIDPNVLSNLVIRTTYAPDVYIATNISSALTLGQYVQRDTNSSPDLGYHYDPLDYVFGGCNLSTNLTFTTGTAVGWFETNGTVLSSPYAILLSDGANLSFSGNATQPCYFSRYAMVQEGGNGNWTNGGLGGIIIDGSGNPPLPQLSADFTKWTADGDINVFSNASPYGLAGFLNCEFYSAGLISDLPSTCFTNCLFFRDLTDFYLQYTNAGFIFQNCTFYDGGLYMARTNAYPATSWTVENSSFDGTDFAWEDYWGGNLTNTTFNFNAYNTNNLSWTNYAYLNPPTNGTLENVGAKDLLGANYNWESSWFGNFYLPTNTPLFQMGSTNANLLGLYHFTTQTNQIPDGTNTVTIGYHYVATDQYGNPLDSNGDGIPDYLEDANGDGLVDNGETPWYYTVAGGLTSTNGLLVFTPLKP
jgi:hypothetical protein